MSDSVFKPSSRFYDPTITVSDIEVWMNVSYATARRLMAKMKMELNIPKYKKPSRSEACQYFGIK